MSKDISRAIIEKVRLGVEIRISNEYRKKMRLLNLGNKHAYIDGRSYLPYCSKFNYKLKEAVRERDNRTCQICWRTENENIELFGCKLSVHNVHYDKENCYPDLIATCSKCNGFLNQDKGYWEYECTKILEERGLLNWKPEWEK